MTSVYVDTNVFVAAALAQHPHHAPAAGVLRDLRKGAVQGYISAHGAAEIYAVLTRVPTTPPIYPSEAWQILERNVFPNFEVVSLSSREYKETLRACAAAGWTGGRVYDALHLAAARKAACERFYTFNIRHFRDMAPDLAQRICAP